MVPDDKHDASAPSCINIQNPKGLYEKTFWRKAWIFVELLVQPVELTDFQKPAIFFLWRIPSGLDVKWKERFVSMYQQEF